VNHLHSFAAIQYPFNIFEPQVALEKNQLQGKASVLELAKVREIANLCNETSRFQTPNLNN
jgi:hypothetical protein